MAEWKIEPLSRHHDRSAFECGNASLDEFIRTLAGQYDRKGVAKTYVLVRNGETQVIGYYVLSAGHIDLGQLPKKLAKKLPRHPVPIVLLARLAIDRANQGMGLGADLLMDAGRRSIQVADEIGVYAMTVDAIDEAAVRFYSRFGFVPLEEKPRHLFLPIESMRNELARRK